MRKYAVFILLTFATIGARAADLPCSLGKYRVPDTKRLAIDCVKRLAAIEGTGDLFLVQNGGVTGGAIQSGSLHSEDLNWLVVVFPQPIEAGKDYEVRINGKAKNKPTDPLTDFDTASFRFTTKPAAVLTIPKRMKSSSYSYGSELWIESPVELNSTAIKDLVFESEDAPGVFVPHAAHPEIEERSGLDMVGTARLRFLEGDAPKQLNSRLRVTGLADIFLQPVPIKMKKRLAPASSPKGKDDAVYYSKLLHQAGVNSLPAWILDGKLAPPLTLRRLANWQLRPSAEADIGQGGAIGKTKTNDALRFAVGVGKFLRTRQWGPIQGIDPTLPIAYETNYTGEKKNLLFAPEARFYVAHTDGSLKQLNFLKFIQARDKDHDIEPQDAPKAFFGYKVLSFVGFDIGSQVSDQQAKASSGDSKVNVPGYRIARIRPKVELDLEFGRITLTLSGVDRYLATTENVYRERDVVSDGKTKKEVYLDTVSGWRPSGEITLSIALDDAGHYAISSSLKLGSLPPNFQRVAVVQSGLTIKF